MLQKQSVADLLIKIKTRCEAIRALVWKAANSFGPHVTELSCAMKQRSLGLKVQLRSVMDATNLVGVSAYSREQAFGDLLNDAMVLPICGQNKWQSLQFYSSPTAGTLP